MKFIIPIRYVIDEEAMRFADVELWKAICSDMGCSRAGVSFGERNDITLESLLEFMEQEFPEGEQSFDDDLMEVLIWDDYDYDLYSIIKYCEGNEIPIDTIINTDNSSECRFFKFYRPGFQSSKLVDVNDYDEPVIPIKRILEIMNTAEEDKSDTDIMLEISKELDILSPYSTMHDIKNWV